MEYEKASDILKNLLGKRALNPEEKEALQTALGLLNLAVISKSRLKNRLQKEKARRDEEIKW